MRFANVVLAFLLSAPVALADVASTKLAFGIDRAAALEALIAHLYPGSTVQWEPRLAVVAADGERRALRVSATVQRNDAGGFTFVMPLEFPAEEPQIMKTIDAFEETTAVSRTEIVAFKTDAAYGITAIRRGSLSDTGQIVQVLSMEEAIGATDLEWPDVYIEYRAVYGTTGWLGEIGWQAKMTTDPVAVVHRLPSYVVKKVKDSPGFAEEPLVIVNEDRVSFTIFSKAARKAVSRCADPCVPDGRVLLALW